MPFYPQFGRFLIVQRQEEANLQMPYLTHSWITLSKLHRPRRSKSTQSTCWGDSSWSVDDSSLTKNWHIHISSLHLQLENETEYVGAFRVSCTPECAKKLGEWLLHLPKTLWELAANNLSASEVKSFPNVMYLNPLT